MTDPFVTPENAALVIVDCQPTLLSRVESVPQAALLNSLASVGRIARLFKLPVVLSKLKAFAGDPEPLLSQLADLLPGQPAIERTTINAWDCEAFVSAVAATQRNKLIWCGLWTETGVTFPALSAIRDGYCVFPLVDAIGGTSIAAHLAALDRLREAGATPMSCVQLASELQRDWSRAATASDVAEILFGGPA